MIETQLYYYKIYRLCHNAPKKPRSGAKFSYVCKKATSSAMHHLNKLGPPRVHGPDSRNGHHIYKTWSLKPDSLKVSSHML